jgi:trk system potassium uptake protein TrkA
VILIELNKEKIDELSDSFDCSFLHGNSGKPAILAQAAPEECDFLFCLTDLRERLHPKEVEAKD